MPRIDKLKFTFCVVVDWRCVWVFCAHLISTFDFAALRQLPPTTMSNIDRRPPLIGRKISIYHKQQRAKNERERKRMKRRKNKITSLVVKIHFWLWHSWLSYNPLNEVVPTAAVSSHHSFEARAFLFLLRTLMLMRHYKRNICLTEEAFEFNLFFSCGAFHPLAPHSSCLSSEIGNPSLR